jgi:hypothetical protein
MFESNWEYVTTMEGIPRGGYLRWYVTRYIIPKRGYLGRYVNR